MCFQVLYITGNWINFNLPGLLELCDGATLHINQLQTASNNPMIPEMLHTLYKITQCEQSTQQNLF